MIKQAKVYRTPGIYKIQNIITRDFYIGSSMDAYKRMYQHQTLLRNNKHHSPHLQHAWNKYGQNKFEYIVLEYVNVETKIELRKIEQTYLNDLCPVYNVSKDAVSPLSTKYAPRKKSHTDKVLPQNKSNWEEVKQKISGTVKSLWSSPEYRENQLASMNSVAAKINYSNSMKNRWKSPEYKDQVKKTRIFGLRSGKNKSSSLSESLVLKIRDLHNNGNSINEISKLLNLQYKNVWRVVTKATWNFV